MHVSQVNGVVIGPAVAAAGVVGTVIAERADAMSPLPWALMTVGGLLYHAIRLMRRADGTAPAGRVYAALSSTWSPVWISAAVLAVAAVGIYGFRSCDDLSAQQRCICHYVGAVKSPLWDPDRDVQADHRAALPAACASDPLLPDVLRTAQPVP